MSEKSKVFAVTFVMLAVLGVPSLAFAADAITSSSFSGVISAITGQLNVSTIAEVLTYAVGVAIAMVFFWWGVRKATRIVMGATRGGHLGI